MNRVDASSWWLAVAEIDPVQHPPLEMMIFEVKARSQGKTHGHRVR